MADGCKDGKAGAMTADHKPLTPSQMRAYAIAAGKRAEAPMTPTGNSGSDLWRDGFLAGAADVPALRDMVLALTEECEHQRCSHDR